MFDQEDEGTRIGVWVALSTVLLVLAGVIGGVAMRQLNHAKAVTPPATAAAAASVSDDASNFIDAPLSGDLVSTVFFALGQSTLPEDARAGIDLAVAALQTAPQRRAVLSGFHDESGTAGVNAEIAKARAKAVREALTAAGVDASRIALRKPDVTLGDGAAPEARRVEIRLID